MLPRVIGITGEKGHGKDTVARILAQRGFKIIRFADPLKAMMRAFYDCHGLSAFMIERRIEGNLKEETDYWLSGCTPRRAMQTLGTEWGREIVSDDLWTGSFLRRADAAFNGLPAPKGLVCPDVRFDNEAQCIRDIGGKVWLVDAGGRVAANEFSGHASEAGVSHALIDATIDNSGPPEALLDQVMAILNSSSLPQVGTLSG